MKKLFGQLRNLWTNYRTGNKQFRPWVRFLVALNVHTFNLPTCSWRITTQGKIVALVLVEDQRMADHIMKAIEEEEELRHARVKVMR